MATEFNEISKGFWQQGFQSRKKKSLKHFVLELDASKEASSVGGAGGEGMSSEETVQVLILPSQTHTVVSSFCTRHNSEIDITFNAISSLFALQLILS